MNCPSMNLKFLILLFHALTSKATDGQRLDVGDIRLVNGTGPYSGRVEISVYGVWGTVCDDSFDFNDAEVMCRMMNLKASKFEPNAFYGPGVGPIFAQKFECSGHEQHLKDCDFVSNVQCTHKRDISIICTDCGKLETTNGKLESISADGRQIKIACKEGYESDVSVSICDKGSWSVSAIYCTSDLQIRLANGIGLYDGRVEVLINGTWGTICGTSFLMQEAQAVCNILFGTRSYRAYRTSSRYYGPGTGPVHMYNFDCKGDEKILDGCKYSREGSCVDHNAGVAVACNKLPFTLVTNTRLVNGTGPYDGRIEMYVNNSWGTIDYRYVDMYDARTICNTHNASLAIFYMSSIYGRGTGPILADQINCYSEKQHVRYCSGYAPYRTHSSHAYDLSIACTPCGLPSIFNGEPISFNGNKLTIACQTGFKPDQVTMTCTSNSWIQEQKCTPTFIHPLQIDDIALKNGYRPTEGRVELKVNGTWGTICDAGFNSADAQVICKMFDLQYAGFYIKAKHRSGRGRGPIYASNMKCNGTESHINECSYDISNNCTHYDDVAVECKGYHLNITDIRLAGSSGPYHGRVELKVNNTWGTVCLTRFQWSGAKFICRMLGLELYYRSLSSSFFGQGSGPIYIDRFECSSYSHFNQCRYSINNYYNCDHSMDAAVMCYGPRLNITAARLVNGTGVNDGRAEIKVNDTWGSICDENFGINAADLFCRLLGLRAAQYFTSAVYGEGSGPVFIDQIFCDDNDNSLSDCRYLFLNECSHAQDISVVCNECGQPAISFWGVDFFTYNDTTLFADCSYYKTYAGQLKLTCNNQTQEWITEGECQEYKFPLDIMDIKLVDGPNSTAGRVEMKSLNTWGTVCDDAFGIQEANVICRMLGYPPAMTFYTSAHFGAGKGPIFIDDLSCEEESMHLNNCTYKTYDNCNHDDDVSVVCTDCGDPKPNNGFINSTMTHYGAAVHVTCNEDYLLFGKADIICQINGEWTHKTTCKKIDCGNPRPANGNINTTSTTNGTVVLVSCENGYTLSGHTIIACQANGTWTQNPTCDIIDCKHPQPENAHVTLIGNKTTFGETAVISCSTGYSPKPGSNVMCLSNGTWEKWPECKIVDCGNPVPAKGSANSTNTIYNTVLEIACEPGYNLTGSPVITCQEDTTWTDLPVCDVSDCGKYSVVNGKVNTSIGTTVGSSVTVECNEGYDLQGSSVIVCKTTGWNDSVSCKIQVCDDPTPDNGKISQTDGVGKYVFGNYAHIECVTGYNLEGDDVITCVSGGNWSAKPTCQLIVCEHHTAPSNGSMDDFAGRKYKSVVIFSCNEGFLLVGEKTSKCGENGKWSSKPPVCEKQSDVGGHCVSKENCLLADSLCINSVCTCLTGINDSSSKRCNKMPLLPYGIDKGDHIISDSDVCGPDISFLPGMPVSGTIRKHLYVCSYGFVSFDTQYTNPSPPQDINSIVTIGEQTIIAVFYGPIDKKTSGPVYFRSYDIINSYDKMKEEKELISYIENIVIKFEKRVSFQASFIMIATWHESKTVIAGFDNTKTSTFQAVLVSDGKSTYVFFIYGHGLMNWKQNDSENVSIWVGHNVANDNLTPFTHPYAFTSQALELDKQPEVSSTEDDVAGLVFRPLNGQESYYENHGVDCINWYNKNYENKKYLDYIASLMPECPCDIWLSRFDPWFWKIGLQRWRKDVDHICVNMLHAGNFRQFGKTCCYDVKTWLWVYERPYAGGFQLYHPITYPLEHILNDNIYKNKCCVYSDYCDLYYELRPTGACYTTSSYDFGTFWGDPHFITLDRKNFTFNGLGEYKLLHVSTSNFTLDVQARTERALKKDGSLSDATVFSAFAVKESSNVSLHVQLNKAKSGMIIYANKADITSQFYSNADPENPFSHIAEVPSGGTLIISKRDETLTALFPTSGISLNISVGAEMLSLNTGVQKQLKGLTTGLLGNYDGNPDNDFTMPNGTVLPGNITEREIFEYGKTWSIDANDSAFIYEEGKSHTDFHNDSYIPRFIDEADPELLLEAEKACNGSQNMECVFDLVFTEKMEIANLTSLIRGESDSTKAELEISVPSLSGCDVIFAKKGQNVSCNIDFDSMDEVIFLENNVAAKLDAPSSSITYFQETTDPVTIRVATRNDFGRSSPAFVVNIVLCTLCNGRGKCSNLTRENVKGGKHFKYAQCICEPYYQGEDCEDDFDGCATNPCSLQRGCTSLTAEKQKAQNRSHICGPCPTGYKVDDEDQCIDVDECANKNHECEQLCTNNEGSFKCSCRDGFMVDSTNSNSCKDVNECDLALHNCSHICVNNEGGFSCQCYSGFEFDASTWTCPETSDEKSCSSSEKSMCSNTSGCTVIDGTTKCFCTDGYELDDSKTTCKDIDECRRGVCPQDCVNTNGSFQCVCFTGYKLQDDNTCKACLSPYWGENCAQKCVCTGRGADRCDPVKGCICKSGWHGDKCDSDIDECAAEVEMCTDPLKTCVDNLGSFSCVCRLGYKLTEENKCEDIDECTDIRLNDCKQDCSNTVGSYSCKCHQGYTRINGTSCKDIDECTLGLDKCEHKCTNNIGFYTCYCHFGYSLSDDRHTCNKVTDQCFTIKNLTCSHFCVSFDGDATCGCMKGYYLNTDNETCSDINECEDRARNKCHMNATCMNTAGSFSCECPVGSLLENDGRTCTECDDFHYGMNCLHSCSCLYGYCDKIKGCMCEQGWFGNKCDIDINECETGQISCLAQNTICKNLLGGAACFCRTGYENSTGRCIDIDECTDTQLNSCDQQCLNTNGSFTCLCHKGFQSINGKCTDIDECENRHGCGQVCENSLGSYICSCEEGFKLQLTDRKTCRPETECSEEESISCPEHSTCYVNNGEVNCTCSKGFKRRVDICEDIDECSPNVQSCDQLCNNTFGSFLCSCHSGFKLQDDKFTCKECGAWTHGVSCQMTCSCDRFNTEKCDPSSGTCLCKPGWNGTNCEDDIDECSNDTACPTNSVCQNSVGSYTCQCNTGYIKTGAKRCEECDSRHFGDDCNQECACIIENTKTCNHVTGDCICNQGWQGIKCLDDVDECQKDNNTCDVKTNSVCKNGVGSFECICKDGFEEQNGVCTDINECLDIEANECEHICTNIPGSYECSCNSGFFMSDRVCKDVDECRNTNTCDHICENTNGSFICSCNSGFYLNQTNRKSCVECENPYYGENCSNICQCNLGTTSVCNNVNGACTCNQGWTGVLCDIDIDECEKNKTICKYKANSTCKNLNGSYICICNDGLRDEDDICTECAKWKYGSNCESNCSCDVSRTEFCNPITGLCKCKSGWNGTICLDDINECEMEKSCPGNATCYNTIGSFECKCNVGYTETDNGLCSECKRWFFGGNCSDTCPCDRDKTDTCDHITGVCTCLKEWTGENCTEDIDECLNNSICNEKANSTCNNTIGSYSCMCHTGFRDMGYQKCEECSGNTHGANCSEICGCNITNSFNDTQTCNTETGQCKCMNGWNGDTCNDDIDECEIATSCTAFNNTTCVNTIGSFLCGCLRGFKASSSDGTCIKESSTTTLKPGNSFKHSLTIEFDLPSSTNLQAADIYNSIKMEILSSLMDFYKKYISNIDILINDIRKGSIIVDYTVVYRTVGDDNAANLTKAVLDLEQGTQITFYGQNVNAISTTYNNMTPCEVYKVTLGSCEPDYQCSVENNIPICRAVSEDNELNWSLVIGLAGAGLFTIIMITIACVFMRHLSRKQKRKKQESRRRRPTAFVHDVYGYALDDDKVHRWKEAQDTHSELKGSKWRNILTGPSVFRRSEHEPAYNQPYGGPHVRKPEYSFSDNNDQTF